MHFQVQQQETLGSNPDKPVFFCNPVVLEFRDNSKGGTIFVADVLYKMVPTSHNMVPTIMNPTSRGPIRIPIYTQVTLTVPIWMFPKIGVFPHKMDGENNEKPY